jgi:[ribosomal protein S5]-alanine N-acetyltransferase
VADAIALAVVPVSIAHVEALLEGDDVFTERFGWTVVPGYLDFPEALPATRDALRNGTPSEWWSQLFIDTDANELVGFGGYKGAPVDGDVEIGYSIAPSRRERGYATEAARLMIERARAEGCTSVSAHTLAEDNASTRVLRRVGMTRVDELTNPDEFPVWRWVLEL